MRDIHGRQEHVSVGQSSRLVAAGAIGAFAATVGFASRALIGAPLSIVAAAVAGGIVSVVYTHVWRHEPVRPWLRKVCRAVGRGR